MDYLSIWRKLWLTLLVFCVYIEQCSGRGGMGGRGGISIGRGGGSRSGIFGGKSGGLNHGKSNLGGPPPAYSANRNIGGRTNPREPPPAYNANRNTGFGQNAHYRNQQQGGFFGGGGAGLNDHRYNKGTGVGSFVRSNQFKNAIVGAAAGYLTYQAGKAIIRSAMTPMMWNNRPYYWGSNYYRGSPGQTMCRMPLEATDEALGKVYFENNTRPREIVWGCGYNEYCCGTECCRSNGFGGYGNYGFGLGSLIILGLIIGCCIFLVKKSCDRNQYIPGRGGY